MVAGGWLVAFWGHEVYYNSSIGLDKEILFSYLFHMMFGWFDCGCDAIIDERKTPKIDHPVRFFLRPVKGEALRKFNISKGDVNE